MYWGSFSTSTGQSSYSVCVSGGPVPGKFHTRPPITTRGPHLPVILPFILHWGVGGGETPEGSSCLVSGVSPPCCNAFF